MNNRKQTNILVLIQQKLHFTALERANRHLIAMFARRTRENASPPLR